VSHFAFYHHIFTVTSAVKSAMANTNGLAFAQKRQIPRSAA
jgi:hypothetical protein